MWFDQPGPWVVRVQAGVPMSKEESEWQPTLMWADGVAVLTEFIEMTTHDAFYDYFIDEAWVARFLIVSPDAYYVGSNIWAAMSEFV